MWPCDALTGIVDHEHRYTVIVAPVPPVGSLQPSQSVFSVHTRHFCRNRQRFQNLQKYRRNRCLAFIQCRLHVRQSPFVVDQVDEFRRMIQYVIRGQPPQACRILCAHDGEQRIDGVSVRPGQTI